MCGQSWGPGAVQRQRGTGRVGVRRQPDPEVPLSSVAGVRGQERPANGQTSADPVTEDDRRAASGASRIPGREHGCHYLRRVIHRGGVERRLNDFRREFSAHQDAAAGWKFSHPHIACKGALVSTGHSSTTWESRIRTGAARRVQTLLCSHLELALQ